MRKTPALLTSTSMPPSSPIAASMAAVVLAASSRSHSYGGPADLAGDRLRLVDEPVEDRDAGALGGERGDDLASDALCSAGDDDPGTGETVRTVTVALAPHDHDAAHPNW